ncbi:MAG TPA: CehA/McbA family metallohydrolase, partial [Propionicimonas sp.]
MGTSTSTSYSDGGLAASTAYSYTVAAYDAAGNISDQSTAAPATTPEATSPGPEPPGWYAGDMHVHRSCGGTAESLSSIKLKMDDEDLRFIALLADCGNGEVQNPTTDLPLVNGQDASISTANRTVRWDSEWHWDATYTQYAHQALGGHVVNLGETSAQQIWDEMPSTIIQKIQGQGGISGFAHMQYLPTGIPGSLDCCTPIEYPVEVALGSADFISEDVTSSGDTAIEAYYKLLNTGFRPGLAAGTDYPCGNSAIGSLLTYSNVGNGAVTYENWINAIKSGKTVISRNGHHEFLYLTVKGSAGPGDEVKLTSAGIVPVTVTWTATASYTGQLQLVQNGQVIASQSATVTAGSPVTLTANVDFAKSGWVAARLMSSDGQDHQVHTGAAFVLVNDSPIRVSADDAQFYVDWMDNLLTKTSPGGEWNKYFPTELAAAQARYQQAKAVFQQRKAEASGPAAPAVSSFTASPGMIIQGQSATLSWATTGNPAPTLTIDNGVGDV